jgi:hypothetical protein
VDKCQYGCSDTGVLLLDDRNHPGDRADDSGEASGERSAVVVKVSQEKLQTGFGESKGHIP